ncbi:hypothetical protein [Alkalicoccobacillus gibsonii]|uniref:hypothetical protein n=1 Tax=Alkalicoccobacillus gibsonii TaxID=79881 RepID=UPI001FE98B08|nr:hypothetical protein [Alkalicoccobacillus gibsonii]
MSTIYETWDEQPVKLTWLPRKKIADKKLITSVHGFCFHENKVLLSLINGRGFNILVDMLKSGRLLIMLFIEKFLKKDVLKVELII